MSLPVCRDVHHIVNEGHLPYLDRSWNTLNGGDLSLHHRRLVLSRNRHFVRMLRR